MSNILTVHVGTKTKVTAGSLFQYSYGQQLKLLDCDLPEIYEVHFSNSEDGVAFPRIGTDEGVSIPDICLQTGETIYAWLFLHDGEQDGRTKCLITIPVIPRGPISYDEPTPEERSIITDTIALLQQSVAHVDEAITRYPKIIEEIWYRWDSASGDYISTGEPSRGPKGDPGDGVASGGRTYQYLRKRSDNDYDTFWDDIPEASDNTPGLVKVFSEDDAYGIGYLSGSQKGLTIKKASANDIRDAASPYKPIVPANQGASVFYGLAQIADDISQKLSNNPVGSYTSEAKTKIQHMLGIDALIPDISHKLDDSLKGAANGLAELDSTGRIPSSQLPSYVDDVIEFESKNVFPLIGEDGKLYVAKDTNLVYRWSGSAYVEISPSLALGETSSTAFRGDRGAAAYAHGIINKGFRFANGFYRFATNAEGHVISASVITKSDITSLGIPGQDTTYENKAAENGGTDLSLVTTGEKYLWNHKYEIPPGGIPASDLASDAFPRGGVTFTPFVASNGDLSWSNDGGKANPATVNLKGPQGDSGAAVEETVTGSTPSIAAVANHRYLCGEVSTISFTPSTMGICEVIFTSGSTAAVLTVPNTVRFPSWFDATSLDSNTIYEISILNGAYGAVLTYVT